MTRYGILLKIIFALLLPTFYLSQLSIGKNSNDLTDLSKSEHTHPPGISKKNNSNNGFNAILGRFSDWVKNFLNPIVPKGPIFHSSTFNFPRIFPFSDSHSGTDILSEQNSHFEGLSIIELNRNKICNETAFLDTNINENANDETDEEQQEQDKSIEFECNGINFDPREFCKYPINKSSLYSENDKDGDGFLKVYSDEKYNITVWVSPVSIQLKCFEFSGNDDKPELLSDFTEKIATKGENKTNLKKNLDSKSPNLLERATSLLKKKSAEIEHHSRISLRHLNESMLNKREIKLNSDLIQSSLPNLTEKIAGNDENISNTHETILSQSFDLSEKFTASKNWMKKQIATGIGIFAVGLILGFFATILIIAVVRKRHLKNSKSKKYTPSKQAKIREKKSAYKLDNDKAWEKFSAMLADTSDEDN